MVTNFVGHLDSQRVRFYGFDISAVKVETVATPKQRLADVTVFSSFLVEVEQMSIVGLYLWSTAIGVGSITLVLLVRISLANSWMNK